MNAGVPPVHLIVLGAADRGDDAAALLAVGALPPELWPLVDVRVRGSLDVVDLVDVPSNATCLVLDAARGLPAGEIRFIPFAAFLARGHRSLPQPRSSHELSVRDVVRLASLIRGRLPVGGFLVVGGSSFRLGALPSREVALAIPRLVQAISDATGRSRSHRGTRGTATGAAATCASR